MKFLCQNCGTTLSAADEHVNKTISCPRCKASVTIRPIETVANPSLSRPPTYSRPTTQYNSQNAQQKNIALLAGLILAGILIVGAVVGIKFGMSSDSTDGKPAVENRADHGKESHLPKTNSPANALSSKNNATKAVTIKDLEQIENEIRTAMDRDGCTTEDFFYMAEVINWFYNNLNGMDVLNEHPSLYRYRTKFLEYRDKCRECDELKKIWAEQAKKEREEEAKIEAENKKRDAAEMARRQDANTATTPLSANPNPNQRENNPSRVKFPSIEKISSIPWNKNSDDFAGLTEIEQTAPAFNPDPSPNDITVWYKLDEPPDTVFKDVKVEKVRIGFINQKCVAVKITAKGKESHKKISDALQSECGVPQSEGVWNYANNTVLIRLSFNDEKKEATLRLEVNDGSQPIDTSK